MPTGLSDLAGYLVVASVITGVWWYTQHNHPADPQPSGSVAATAIEHYRQDLATAHRSAARRLRSGEIKNEADLHTFIKFAEHKSRQRSFTDLDKAQADLSGENWTPTEAAQLCDRLATDFGR